MLAPKTPLLFLGLGHQAPPKQLSDTAEIRYIPFQSEPTAIARYYQAADIYLHAAHADNAPNVISEAMACGLPVIATQVGGIPEQVRAESGILTPPTDAEAMAQAAYDLLKTPEKRQYLGTNAAQIARQDYDLHTQIQAHLDWYAEVLHDHHP